MLCWLRIIDTSFAARFTFFSFRARPGLALAHVRSMYALAFCHHLLYSMGSVAKDGWMDGWIILLSSSRLWYGVKSWVENECESGIVLAYGSFVVGQWACTAASLFFERALRAVISGLINHNHSWACYVISFDECDK